MSSFVRYCGADGQRTVVSAQPFLSDETAASNTVSPRTTSNSLLSRALNNITLATSKRK